ncbi:MAG: recombination regulator RecX [Armatimonadetes bacterium]|nr:recombination regulator RecX [Armatimonadota bacterium]
MRRKTSEKLSRPDDEQAARDTCLRLLSRRARSAGELRERLRTGGFSTDVAEGVLSNLEDAGLIDDEEFTRSWVSGRKAAGGASRRRIDWELRRKGVDRDLIERVLREEMDDRTELGQAAQLARKKLRGQRVDGKELSRLRRHLLGRGFGFDTVDSVLQAVAREEET